MNGSCVIPKIAEIESTAKRTAVISIMISTRVNGVSSRLPLAQHSEACAVVTIAHGQQPAHETDERIPPDIGSSLPDKEHLDAREEQKAAKKIKRPSGTFQRRRHQRRIITPRKISALKIPQNSTRCCKQPARQN